MFSERDKIIVLYHYMYPDDVVSARHYDDLCAGLVSRGWEVEAKPCNRVCRDETKSYEMAGSFQGIQIRRIWRLPLKQSSSIGRIVNAIWMITSWGAIIFRRQSALPHCIIIGTDPIFSVAIAIIFKFFRPNITIAHWCFDLYPEAIATEGILPAKSVLYKVFSFVMAKAYKSCDLIVDIGECMRSLFLKYKISTRMETLVPWALFEPDKPLATDSDERAKLFGKTDLGLLYSGNFGRAHSCNEILMLARSLRAHSIRFCFSVRGNRVSELHASITDADDNISFVDFAAEEDLEKRLGAADIHLVSLQPDWTGVVVPSKFFGCLAAGRPVIFSGSVDSSIAKNIHKYKVGWVLNENTLEEVCAELITLSSSPAKLLELQEHCHNVYRKYFSKEVIIDGWDSELRKIISWRKQHE
jgi:glycosyltransferase involved in cell wall biosynthesis